MVKIGQILTPRLVADKYLSVTLVGLKDFDINIISSRRDISKIIENLNRGLAEDVRIEQGEKIVYVSKSNLAKGLPSYLEFSVDSYKSPYYCVRGIVIASSEDVCPLLRECKFRTGKGENTCSYYVQSRSTFLGLYKMFVDLRSYVKHVSKVEPLDTVKVKLSNEERDLIEVSLYKCSIIERIACIRLERRERTETRRTLLLFPCLSFCKKHSREILSVPTIVLRVNQTAMCSLLESRRSSKDVAVALNWCKFKYSIVGNYFKKVFVESSSKWFPRRPWRRSQFYENVDDFIDSVKTGNINVSIFGDVTIEKDNMFRKFLLFVLLNTLAHIIVGYICSKYGCTPSYFNYIVDLEEGKLYIYEKATGGLGYIEAFSREYPGLDKILTEWRSNIVEYESRLMAGRNTSIKISSTTLQGTSLDFQNTIRIVCEISQQLSRYGVYLPITVLRRVLGESIDPENLNDVKVFNSILETYNACFDGCKICILQDKLGPLTMEENAFLVSKSLAIALAECLNESVARP